MEPLTFISRAPGPVDGIPLAVKDNIDVSGFPTTCGLPSRDKPAETSATVVERLVAAGYGVVGKTNLDQFATGLVGTRSPYGALSSVPDPARISGGSSSGSAVAVASGEVPLALGTDTAGSGRVPAAFNGLVGVKPTRGRFPTRGVFPACRSLDCVTTFTRTVAEARAAFAVLDGPDPLDPMSRPVVRPAGVAQRMTVVGVPAGALDLDEAYAAAWAASVERARARGLRVVPVDVTPFLEAAQLLYAGPWLAERWHAFGELLDDPGADPAVQAVVTPGRDLRAADAFAAFDRLAELRLRTAPVWEDVDALLLPVAPTHPTHAAVAADPLGVNSRLGTFTNFVNLLDLAAVAVPGTSTFGVQLIGPAFSDEALLDLAAVWTGEPAATTPSGPATAELVLVGAHMSGLPLNHLVTGRGGRLARRARTTGAYGMVRVPGPGVPRPALVHGTGAGFDVEVWELPHAALGALAAELAPPLGWRQVQLDDGTSVLGYVGDDAALRTAESLDGYAGWRDYLRASGQ